jgi:vacuolar-type H+-ATPase subunit H
MLAISARDGPRKLTWVRKEASRVSGAGETVTVPLASAAEALTLEGVHSGATDANLGEAAAPAAVEARATTTASARMARTVSGKRERIRGRAAMSASLSPYHWRMELGEASGRVKSIVDAAERAAGQLREEAEERARERIAEADRAAANRVQAAEEEVEEILANARNESERMLANAQEQVRQTFASGEERLAVQRAEAEEKAGETRARARTEAREIVSEAHVIAREVMQDGDEVSRNLRDLSASMRSNAERLLRDVRLTHGSMTARLDQAAPDAPGTPRGENGLPHSPRKVYDDPDSDLDVPEFMPRG